MSAPTVAGPALTPRQTAVLTAIRDHTLRHGFAPSTREIGDATGLSSTSSVLHHLRSLHDRGLLSRGEMGRRAVALTDLARETLAYGGLTFDEYESLVRRAHAAHPNWRLGQTYVNVLHTFAPDVLAPIEKQHRDCFYRDDMIPGFLDQVRALLSVDTTLETDGEAA